MKILMLFLVNVMLVSCINNKNARLWDPAGSSVSPISVDLDPITGIPGSSGNTLTGICTPDNSIVSIDCGAGVFTGTCVNGSFSIPTVSFGSSVPVICNSTITDSNGSTATDNETTSAPGIDAVDQTVKKLTVGVPKVIDVSSNDLDSNCAPITYTAGTCTNCTLTGLLPSVSVTVTALGAWDFTYTATCSDGTTTDSAIVSGNVLAGSLASIDAVDDMVSSSIAGTPNPSINVATNDTKNFFCGTVTYLAGICTNCTFTGSLPTVTVTPTAQGAWNLAYTATCSDGSTADTASIFGTAASAPVAAIIGHQPSGPIGINNNKVGIIGGFSDDSTYNDTCTPPGTREIQWTFEVNGTDVGSIAYATLATPITLAGSNSSSTHGDLLVDDWTTFLPAVGGSAPGLGDVICVRNNVKNCDGTSGSSDSNEVCFCSPSKQVFAYTGADQNITVPIGASETLVKSWGAGGGCEKVWNSLHANGGAGGYSESKFSVTVGADYSIVIGERGYEGDNGTHPSIYGFGAPSGAGNDGTGAGLTGLFTGNSPVLSSDQVRSVVIAGGGGGGGIHRTDDCASSAFVKDHGGAGGAPNSGGEIDFSGATGICNLHNAGAGGGYEGGTNTFSTVKGGSSFIQAGSGFLQYNPIFGDINSVNSLDVDYAVGTSLGCDGENNALFGGHGQLVTYWIPQCTTATPVNSLSVAFWESTWGSGTYQTGTQGDTKATFADLGDGEFEDTMYLRRDDGTIVSSGTAQIILTTDSGDTLSLDYTIGSAASTFTNETGSGVFVGVETDVADEISGIIGDSELITIKKKVIAGLIGLRATNAESMKIEIKILDDSANGNTFSSNSDNVTNLEVIHGYAYDNQVRFNVGSSTLVPFDPIPVYNFSIGSITTSTSGIAGFDQPGSSANCDTSLPGEEVYTVGDPVVLTDLVLSGVVNPLNITVNGGNANTWNTAITNYFATENINGTVITPSTTITDYLGTSGTIPACFSRWHIWNLVWIPSSAGTLDKLVLDIDSGTNIIEVTPNQVLSY